MDKKGFYPGRALTNLKLSRFDKRGNAVLTLSDNSMEFYLERKFFPENLPKSSGKTLPGMAVILEQLQKGYKIAVKNYSKELFRIIYKNDWNTAVYDIPWIDLWESAFSGTKLKFNKTGNRKDTWDVKFPWAVIPGRGNRYLNQIHNCQKYLFPDNLYCRKKIQHHNYAVYGFHRNIELPKIYEAKLKINNDGPRKVSIFLHGPLDPMRWHLKLWKHLTDDERISRFPGSKERWIAYSGMEISDDVDKIFEKCQPPNFNDSYFDSYKQPRRCKPDCVRFSEVEKKIEFYNRKYLEHAVLFFEKLPTNKSDIYTKQYVDGKPPVMQFNDFLFYEKIPFKSNEPDTVVLLVLKGVCYNWNQHHTDPVIHLHIITFYAGDEKSIPFPPSDTRYKPNKTGTGRIISIKKVN